MTLSDYRKIFQKELAELYSESEIAELFVIFAGKILDKNRIEIRRSLEDRLGNSEQKMFDQYLSELKTGKPFQLILGETEFFGMTFFVNEHTLIPRPETEELLELALAPFLPKGKKSRENERYQFPTSNSHSQTTTPQSPTPNPQPLTILDIGTGSGIIPIILKKYFPEAEISAMDISAEALEIAKKNADFHKCEINFIQADYLAEELSGKFDLIISNPPYIGIDEKQEIEESVKGFEPEMALFSPTEDPLVFYRKIASDATKHLKNGGFVFLEINQKLGAETLALFENFAEHRLLKDISGNDRFIVAQR